MDTFSLAFALKQFPQLLKALPVTLLITVVSMAVGLALGTAIALCRMYRVPVLGQLAHVYVSFIRGTPLLVQIYVLFYGTPVLLDWLESQWGWPLPADGVPPLLYACFALSINTAAYQSEIIRSALGAVDSGQMEAAYSVGMSTRQALLRIVIPQALVSALPNFGNTFIGLVKGTSLAFSVKVVEIMAVAKIEAGDGYRYLEMYLNASILYWIICFGFERAFSVMEKRLSRHERAPVH
ncbi:amino acid ABC transporter permease [Paenibacillus hodogayensis]|uniref:Amino acid ABC transporter permease n=1 Tax=Paenibacillus hodogayensis TaxID=279208 RepID=A0ABV5VR99_9BACL